MEFPLKETYSRTTLMGRFANSWSCLLRNSIAIRALDATTYGLEPNHSSISSPCFSASFANITSGGCPAGNDAKHPTTGHAGGPGGSFNPLLVFLSIPTPTITATTIVIRTQIHTSPTISSIVLRIVLRIAVNPISLKLDAIDSGRSAAKLNTLFQRNWHGTKISHAVYARCSP